MKSLNFTLISVPILVGFAILHPYFLSSEIMKMKLDGTPDNVAIWATKARKIYYLNPFPDHFYSGNSTEEEFVGLRENYYAGEWGDALFVVLDHYWYTKNDPKSSGDNWAWTLGDDQYQWFKHTLEQSNATFKFIFCHHLLGECRGAVEWAKYYAWGGYNKNGTWQFDERRRGWGKPMHQLMVENGVTIFFQGHDYIFVKQKLDGIVYQTCPMPADPTYIAYNEQHFLSGVKFPNSGYMRVTVADTAVKVDYIRAFLPEDETSGHKNGEIAYSYTVNANATTSTSLKSSSPPDKFRLEQNYPNQFNPITQIRYQITRTEEVELIVYNLIGEKMLSLVKERQSPGSYVVEFNAYILASGVYFYHLKAEDFNQVGKMVLVR